MTTLVHRTPLSEAAPFDLAALKLHARVDGDDSDSELSRMGFTAAAQIEHFAQIALLDQTIRVTAFNINRVGPFMLPVGPCLHEEEISVSVDGWVFHDFSVAVGVRPCLLLTRPIIAETAVIEYRAGFGGNASDIPAALSEALIDQALLLFDGRAPMDSKALSLSPHTARVAARYRGVSL